MDPWQLTLTESAAEQASGRLSSVELVGSVLDRIEAVDAKVGAFRVVLGEEALAQARACDIERSAGRVRGPMHGLPVAVKDVIDVAGQATTGSSRAYADRVAQQDAHCVTRLRAAGAVIVGKTETHELALGVITPATRNSRDLSRIPGGSSGGSGAAVAAGTGALALGTDTGGSVRIPASLCGVVGLKPSYGRVSNSGLMPTAWSLDTIGPIVRDVPDAALALTVLAGHDSRDPVSLDLRGRWTTAPASDRGVDGLVLGLATGFFAARVQPAVTEAVTAAAEALARCGATIRPVELPAGEYMLAFSLARPEAAAVHARVLRGAAAPAAALDPGGARAGFPRARGELRRRAARPCPHRGDVAHCVRRPGRRAAAGDTGHRGACGGPGGRAGRTVWWKPRAAVARPVQPRSEPDRAAGVEHSVWSRP